MSDNIWRDDDDGIVCEQITRTRDGLDDVAASALKEVEKRLFELRVELGVIKRRLCDCQSGKDGEGHHHMCAVYVAPDRYSE